jgi:hypothetical protein
MPGDVGLATAQGVACAKTEAPPDASHRTGLDHHRHADVAMTNEDEPYKPLSVVRGITIKSLFDTLLATGHTPVSARALLQDSWDLRRPPPPTDPPLQDPRFRFDSDGRLTIQVAEGRVDPATVFIRWPSPLEGGEPLPPFVDLKDDTKPAPAAANDGAKTAVVKPRRGGGVAPDHNWKGAAAYVDAIVAKAGPLPRRENGAPSQAHAFKLMKEWFEKNETPPLPERETYYHWLKDNPHPEWWGDAPVTKDVT